jgi:hypothetical protein
VAEGHGHDVVSIGEGIGLDDDDVADDALDGEAAAIDLGADVLDDRPAPSPDRQLAAR